MRIPVVLQRPISGEVLFNAVSEIAREAFHDVRTMGEPRTAYFGANNTKNIVGSSFSANFTFNLVRKVKKFFSWNEYDSYKKVEETLHLSISLRTLYPDVQYSCFEIEIYRLRAYRDGTRQEQEDFNVYEETVNDFLVVFQEFLGKVYKKLAEQNKP